MFLAYVLIFLLHLSASTCHATSRNQHLLFAGRADATATALFPAAMMHHSHHHRQTAKTEVLSVDNYSDDVRQYHHPAMMARRWGGGAQPSTSPASVELAGIGGSPPRLTSLKSAVEPSAVVDGAPPPPPGKQDTSAAMDPSPMPSPAHGEAGASSSSAASDDVDVDADYDGPMTHPPSHN